MTERERRKFPVRSKSINLVYFAVFSSDGIMIQQGMGRTLNISLGGILIETRDKISKHGGISLSLGLGDEVLEIYSDTVHFCEHLNGFFHIGLAFKKCDKGKEDKIEEYIKNFKESES